MADFAGEDKEASEGKKGAEEEIWDSVSDRESAAITRKGVVKL